MKNYQHLNLDQKLVKVRKKIPSLIRKRYSEEVDYDFLKMEDINEFLTPALDRYGVNFDIVEESSTMADKETGRAIFLVEENGLWRYEANLVLRWINADRPEEIKDVFLHAIGTHETADKAKGTAWTYCIKYYLMHKFNIRQAAFEDPDMMDLGQKDTPQGESRENHPAVQAPEPPKTTDPSLEAVLEKSKQAAARLADEEGVLENGTEKPQGNPPAESRTEVKASAKAVKKSQPSTSETESAPPKTREGKCAEGKNAGKRENPEEVKAKKADKNDQEEETKGGKIKAKAPKKAIETDGFTPADEEEIPFEEDTKSGDDYFFDDDFFTGDEEKAASKEKEDSPADWEDDSFTMEEEAVPNAADDKLEAARNYPCNYGIYMGRTMGEVLDSGDSGKKALRWLATSYKGGNTELKKAARLLLGMKEEAEDGIAA